MANYVIKIIDDITAFSDRCDEITLMDDWNKAKSAVPKLKDTLKANPTMVALAAPQIGIHERIFVCRFGKEYKVFMNPIIVNQSKERFLSEEEYVFSKNPKHFLIHRPTEITVAFQDINGNVEQMTLKKIAVCPIMQMIDLLDGMLDWMMYYVSLELDDTWEKKSKSEKEEIIKNFEEMVKENSAKFSTDIANDEELKKLDETIEFNKKVLLGDVKPAKADESIDDVFKREAEAKAKAEEAKKELEKLTKKGNIK